MGNARGMERRIRRHLLGKRHTFFASTSPGMEQLCRQELLSLDIPVPEEGVVKGGVTFQGRVHTSYIANLELRTANRVLMRIDSFDATNFRQLAKKIAAIPWELFLHKERPVGIRVTARGSRLYHTDAITDQVREAMARRWDLSAADPKSPAGDMPTPQDVFVRIVKDRVTISVDSSGDALYKRGMKTQGGRAPLRETTAAAVLFLCGYDGNEPLLDPMCGTGTFSLEAAMVANRIPAGHFRTFAFMGWPCFRPARWGYIRRETEKSMIERTDPIVFAADKDPECCHALTEVIHDHGLSGTVSVLNADFLDISPGELVGTIPGGKKGLVVINPPYGRRLETRQRSEELFLEVCCKLKTDFRGWKMALIAPKKDLLRRVPFPVTTGKIFHGGLRLTLLTGRMP